MRIMTDVPSRFRTVVAGCVLASGLALPAAAQETDAAARDYRTFAAAVSAGSMGFGLEPSVAVAEKLSLRVPIRYYKYDTEVTEGGIAYQGSLKLGGLGFLGDFHPFANGFRLSGGAFLNFQDISLTATPSASVSIGGVPYLPGQVGTIAVTADYAALAPYAGIGYGGAVKSAPGLEFFADLGILYTGQPDLTMTTSGGVVSLLDINSELNEIEGSFPSIAPVIQLGLSYRF